MERERVNQMLAEIRQAREQTLKELVSLGEEVFYLPTTDKRWSEIRRVLLRFGDHLREHTTQIEGARVGIGRAPTMVQRILARSETAWGLLLAATTGLEDEDLDSIPSEGEWSIQQALDHILTSERYYQDLVTNALKTNQEK